MRIYIEPLTDKTRWWLFFIISHCALCEVGRQPLEKLQKCSVDISQLVLNGFCRAYSTSSSTESGRDRSSSSISVKLRYFLHAIIFYIDVSELAFQLNFQSRDSTFGALSLDICGKMKPASAPFFPAVVKRWVSHTCSAVQNFRDRAIGEGKKAEGPLLFARNGVIACLDSLLEPYKLYPLKHAEYVYWKSILRLTIACDLWLLAGRVGQLSPSLSLTKHLAKP